MQRPHWYPVLTVVGLGGATWIWWIDGGFPALAVFVAILACAIVDTLRIEIAEERAAHANEAHEALALIQNLASDIELLRRDVQKLTQGDERYRSP